MQKRLLLIFPTLVLGLLACNQSGKTADDIEKEYSDNSTTATTNHNTTEVSKSETENLTDTEEVDFSNFEYLEDFGSIHSKTELYQTFGADNLKDGTSWFAEGTVEMSNTSLTDPNTLNTYVYVWMDDNETLSFIEGAGFIWDENYDMARRQVIMSKSGVFTGMTVKELRDWNDGQDFKFSGFGWDYEGGIFVEKGSKLAEAGVIVKLTLDDNTGSYTNLLGDSEFSTADEGILEAPIVIDLLTYSPSIKL